MLGLGAWELAAVLVVALVVLGPEKIPEVARRLARLIGQARRMADDVKRNIDDALQEEQPSPAPPPPSAFTDWVQRQQDRGNAPPAGTLAASDGVEALDVAAHEAPAAESEHADSGPVEAAENEKTPNAGAADAKALAPSLQPAAGPATSAPTAETKPAQATRDDEALP